MQLPTLPRLPVRPHRAARYLAQWLVNPVSARGVAYIHWAQYEMLEPRLRRQLDEMRDHPDGRRILERRTDLGLALDDPELGELPEGTLGRTYRDFVSAPEAIPSFMLTSVIHLDRHLERLGWDDDMVFLAERLANTHDLVHVLSGYGTHLAAEALNINFIIGIMELGPRPVSEGWSAVSAAVLLPSVGVLDWRRQGNAAYERGRRAAATKPFHCIPWEDLFATPLDEVRRQLGVEPLAEPVDTSDWIRSPLGRAMATGFGGATAEPREHKERRIRLTKALVAAGVPMREIVNLEPGAVEDLLALVERGDDPAALRRAASDRGARVAA